MEFGRFEGGAFEGTLLEENSTGEGNEGAEAEIDNVEREEMELLRERERPCECFGM